MDGADNPMNTEEIRRDIKDANKLNNEATRANMEARLLDQGFHVFDLNPPMLIITELDD